ncbi:MAG: AAA family ATPase [Deltaproteobacteria bacterium]|nr:AAA family ATPase [Deltaproteobacteria bacterium]
MNSYTKTEDSIFRLGDRYRTLEVLAEGGMSVLYAGIDQRTGQKVAIKLMRHYDLQKKGPRKRFEREIQTTLSLKHPNIIEVIDTGVNAQGTPYLVLELLQGRSLEEELAVQGHLSVERAIEWLLPLIGALAYSHDRGIVHRDIKPSNIYLVRDREGHTFPKLLDFGIAVAFDSTRITRSGLVVGSVQYMSPEQASGAEVGPTTDVWSMAAVLFRCLTGRVPFEAETAAGLLLKIVKDSVPALATYAPSVGPRISAAVDRALEKNLRLRFPDMRSFARALCEGALSAGVSLPANPDPIGLPRWPTWCRIQGLQNAITADFVPAGNSSEEFDSDAISGLATAAALPHLSKQSLTTFVERDHECETLDSCFEMARQGFGRVVGIVGEAGVGKSRLLWEWRRRFPSGQFLYLEGQCQSHSEAVIYAPLREMLYEHFRICENDQPNGVKQKLIHGLESFGDETMNYLAPISELFSLPVEDTLFQSLEPSLKRDRIIEAVISLLIRISQDQPLVITVQDLHWVDKSTEFFLEHFCEAIVQHRVLLIVLYRNDYVPIWIDQSNLTQIRLLSLQRGSMNAVLRSLLNTQAVTPELVEFIYDRSYGNPLYVEELTRVLLENGLIQREQGRLMANPNAIDLIIPKTVQEIIANRIERLEEDLKRTVQMAAVIGPDFVSNILQIVSGKQNELRAHLSKLHSMELIYSKAIPSEGRFAFKHGLTRDVAYQTQLADKRKESHQKTAETIESVYADRLDDLCEALAYHYYNAENWPKTLIFAKRSGEKALQNYSNWEAVRFFEQALLALQRLGSTDDNKREQIAIRRMLDMALPVVGCYEDALENLRRLEQLSIDLKDARGLVITYVRMNTLYSHQGKPLKVRAYTEKEFEQAWESEDIDLIMTFSLGLCETYALSGEYYKVADFAPRVVALLENTQNKGRSSVYPINTYTYLCVRIATSLALLGKFKEGWLYCSKNLNNAAELNDIFSLGLAELGVGSYWLAKGNATLSIKHALKSIEFLQKSEWSWLLRDLWAILSRAYAYLDDAANAIAFAQKAIQGRDEKSPSLLAPLPEISLGAVYLELGCYTESSESLELGLKVALERGDRFFEGVARISLARTMNRISESHRQRAEQEIRLGIEILERLRCRVYIALGSMFLGEVLFDQGKRVEAIAEVEKAKNMFLEMQEEYWIHKASQILSEYKVR